MVLRRAIWEVGRRTWASRDRRLGETGMTTYNSRWEPISRRRLWWLPCRRRDTLFGTSACSSMRKMDNHFVVHSSSGRKWGFPRFDAERDAPFWTFSGFSGLFISDGEPWFLFYCCFHVEFKERLLALVVGGTA